MTLGTIIAIVLGIVVLVFLIFGFAQGWGNLWDRITQFGGGDVNVDTVVQACALKCSTGDKFGFCNETRVLKNGTATIDDKACIGLASYGVASCGNICN